MRTQGGGRGVRGQKGRAGLQAGRRQVQRPTLERAEERVQRKVGTIESFRHQWQRSAAIDGTEWLDATGSARRSRQRRLGVCRNPSDDPLTYEREITREEQHGVQLARLGLQQRSV